MLTICFIMARWYGVSSFRMIFSHITSMQCSSRGFRVCIAAQGLLCASAFVALLSLIYLIVCVNHEFINSPELLIKLFYLFISGKLSSSLFIWCTWKFGYVHPIDEQLLLYSIYLIHLYYLIICLFVLCTCAVRLVSVILMAWIHRKPVVRQYFLLH